VTREQAGAGGSTGTPCGRQAQRRVAPRGPVRRFVPRLRSHASGPGVLLGRVLRLDDAHAPSVSGAVRTLSTGVAQRAQAGVTGGGGAAAPGRLHRSHGPCSILPPTLVPSPFAPRLFLACFLPAIPLAGPATLPVRTSSHHHKETDGRWPWECPAAGLRRQRSMLTQETQEGPVELVRSFHVGHVTDSREHDASCSRNRFAERICLRLKVRDVEFPDQHERRRTDVLFARSRSPCFTMSRAPPVVYPTWGAAPPASSERTNASIPARRFAKRLQRLIKLAPSA
jgi:hypothetical protein